jgi:hypothetical protein
VRPGLLLLLDVVNFRQRNPAGLIHAADYRSVAPGRYGDYDRGLKVVTGCKPGILYLALLCVFPVVVLSN